jgi:hypothetical protein
VGSSFRPNRLDVFASVAVVVTTGLFLDEALHAAILYSSVQRMSAWDQAAGCFGWLLATFGPVTTSVVFWRWSKRFAKGWILHLLMLPLAYTLVAGGSALMLFSIGVRDFDDTIGAPVIQAGALFVLATTGYYCTVIYTISKKSANSATVN